MRFGGGNSDNHDSSAGGQSLGTELCGLEMRISSGVTVNIDLAVDCSVVSCAEMIDDVIDAQALGSSAQELEDDDALNIRDWRTTGLIRGVVITLGSVYARGVQILKFSNTNCKQKPRKAPCEYQILWTTKMLTVAYLFMDIRNMALVLMERAGT